MRQSIRQQSWSNSGSLNDGKEIGAIQPTILKYQDIHGANNLIKLSKAWLRMFYLHNNEFVLMETEDGEQGFFQVIGSESLKVLYS